MSASNFDHFNFELWTLNFRLRTSGFTVRTSGSRQYSSNVRNPSVGVHQVVPEYCRDIDGNAYAPESVKEMLVTRSEGDQLTRIARGSVMLDALCGIFVSF